MSTGSSEESSGNIPDQQPDGDSASVQFVLDHVSSSADKTPISFLQETCTKQGTKPDYELLSTEGQVHEPTFVYRVTVNDLSAIGQGKAKKTARHLAAKNLLERIIAVGRFQEFGMGDTPAEATKTLLSLKSDVVAGGGQRVSGGSVSEEAVASPPPSVVSASATSDDGDGPGNPVGRLQERCQQNKWQAPQYELISEDGPPHNRVFVLEIKLGKFEAQGTGKSKKLAKRDAAERILKLLDKISPEIQREHIGVAEEDDLAETGGGQAIIQKPFDELDEHFSKLSAEITAYVSTDEKRGLSKLNGMDLSKEKANAEHKFISAMTLHGHQVKPITPEAQQQADAFYEDLKSEHGDFFDTLRALPDSVAPNYVQLLQRVSQTCNFDILYHPNEARTSKGDYQCLVQLNAMPVAVCYGQGATKEDATQSAAFNALQYLKMMTKQ